MQRLVRLLAAMTYNGVVIFVRLDVTELSAGYRTIQDFLDAMRQEWLPGFERSYLRRTSEYRQALAKYEKRGLFLRTLLGKPKQPGHIPELYPAQVEDRLWHGWREAVSSEEEGPADANLQALDERLDDRFLALRGVHTQREAAALDVVIGPPGVLLVNASEQAAATVEPIQTPGLAAAAPIARGNGAAWPPKEARKVLDEQQIYAQAESWLERHQALGRGSAFSALAAAEKLTADEKGRLLRMAATL